MTLNDLRRLTKAADTFGEAKDIAKAVEDHVDTLLVRPKEAYDFIREAEMLLFAMTKQVAGDDDLVYVQNCVDRIDTKIAKAMSIQ